MGVLRVTDTPARNAPRAIGRYLLFDEIASGGMATVHLGRLLGPAGFSRTVAVKRLHPQYAKDPEFVAMFLDEARLAARIRHPNVVSTLDVVAEAGELFLVMEFIQGESLARLLRAALRVEQKIPPPIAVAMGSQALLGLHAAHEATNERGDALGIVHRDVSPQNILVGVDGVAHVVDFGVAKAAARIHTTQDGTLKGKIAYMAPEQLKQQPLDRRTDVFAASVVIWETLTNRRLFAAGDVAASVTKILNDDVPAPSRFAPELPAALDAVVLKGLERDPTRRHASAREMARALQTALAPASALEVGEWVETVAGEVLAERREQVADVESKSTTMPELPDVVAAALDGRRSVADGSSKTELSSALPSGVPARRPARGAWIGAVALVLLLLGVGAWLFGGSRRADPVAADRSPPDLRGTSGSAAAAADPEQSPSAAASAPAALPPSVAAPVPSTMASEAAPRDLAPSAAAATRKVPAAKPVAKPVAKPHANCTPPYTLNPDGSKRFKPECF
jgi:serine/threonine protein kinase